MGELSVADIYKHQSVDGKKYLMIIDGQTIYYINERYLGGILIDFKEKKVHFMMTKKKEIFIDVKRGKTIDKLTYKSNLTNDKAFEGSMRVLGSMSYCKNVIPLNKVDLDDPPVMKNRRLRIIEDTYIGYITEYYIQKDRRTGKRFICWDKKRFNVTYTDK